MWQIGSAFAHCGSSIGFTKRSGRSRRNTRVPKEGDARLYTLQRIGRNVLLDEKMLHAAPKRRVEYFCEVDSAVA